MVKLIWATRGRVWGFRFLLDGGHANPLTFYESAFVGAENEIALCRRSGNQVALRFPDPMDRKDAAGRVIPHDFVVSGTASASINSVGDGLREIWPLVDEFYGRTWDSKAPPSPAMVKLAFSGDKP